MFVRAEMTSPEIAATPTKTHWKRPQGRPSKFTPQIAAEIVQRLSSGEPMAEICRSHHMPDVSTVWDWTQKDESFSQSIARARISGFDMIAADCLRIADGNDGVEGDASMRRVRVETRLKLLAKWDPKRYGDRIEQAIEIETGPKTLESIEERAKHVAAVLSLARK